MNFLNFVLKLLACVAVLSIFGCGSKDVNGSLTVVAGSPSTSAQSSRVTFTVTYTNPQKSDVIGTEIAVVATLSGINGAQDASQYFEYSTSNSGINTFTYSVPRAANDQTLTLSAQTGSLKASDSATITGLGTLTANPASVSFPLTDPKGTPVTVALSGGLAPYTATSPTTDIIVVTSGSSLTVIKNTDTNHGTVNITVTDSISPNPSGLTIPVTY